MIKIERNALFLTGPKGFIPIKEHDEITLKLGMLFEGECEGLGSANAAEKFGFTRQRYYQILQAFKAKGAEALKNRKRGPKRNYRRTGEVVRQIIRYRFLDPHISPEVIAQNSYNVGMRLRYVVLNGLSLNMAFKKKLHMCRPGAEPVKVETHRTKQKVRLELCDPQTIERDVRQLLANKISGNMVGIWLLIPEYLRLGAWDLLKSWSGMPDNQVETRLAMQLVNERALCVTGIREKRTVSQKGFELANGLPS